MHNFISLTHQNLASEHICCAFSDKKCAAGYEAKKQWIKDQLDLGFTFCKLDVRGKVFIEYIPAEFSRHPVVADNCMMINCFWVSGQYKEMGYGKQLLQHCIADSAGKSGIIAIVSNKKMPFLSDKKFLHAHGFKTVDTSPPYFELMYLPLNDAPAPKFSESVRKAECDIKEGLAVYYSDACPFTDFYVKDFLKIAGNKGFKAQAIKIDTLNKAQNHFVPATIYSVFRDGKFVTHQILNESMFNKFIG
jgi:hypothetical protein